jgi:hypothetical protein
MADDHRSLQALIESLGFHLGEEEFLRRIFWSSDPFEGLPEVDDQTNSRRQSYLSSRGFASLASFRFK